MKTVSLDKFLVFVIGVFFAALVLGIRYTSSLESALAAERNATEVAETELNRVKLCEAAWKELVSSVESGSRVYMRQYRDIPAAASIGPFGLILTAPTRPDKSFPLDCREYQER